MTHPPQQPQDGWQEQQPGQPVDPHQGGQPDAPAYPYQGQYGGQPVYHPEGYPQQAQRDYYPYPQSSEEPPTDQTQALPAGGMPPQHQQPPQPEQAPEPPVRPIQPIQPIQPFPPAHNPQSYPVSGQPWTGAPPAQQPVQPFPAAPTSGSPISAQPSSGGGYPPAGVPASPFAPAPPPVSGQPWGPPHQPMPAQFTPRKRKGPPSWLYVVGAVVVVAALAVGAVFYFGLGTGGGDDSEKPAEEEEPAYEAAVIADEGAGLGYLSLPPPWEPVTELKGYSEEGFEGVAAGLATENGQALWAEDGQEAGEGWLGLFAVGELDTEQIEYKGASSIKNATLDLADYVDAEHWKDPTDKKRETMLSGLKRDAEPGTEDNETYMRVDGRRAYFVEYHVSWESDSIAETGATVILGVVDLGEGRAGAVMVDLPDSLADHRESVDAALLTLRFE